MDVVLSNLISVTGVLLGTVLGFVIQRHTTRKDQLRANAARFAYQLSVRRGHLYKRWEIARRENPEPREVEAANDTSKRVPQRRHPRPVRAARPDPQRETAPAGRRRSRRDLCGETAQRGPVDRDPR
jgi:hypothetical protein